MAYPDLQINAAGVMANQPTSIRFFPASPTMVRLAGGGYTAAVRSAGARIVIHWGVTRAADGAYDELIADLAGALAARLRWEDPAGNTFDFQVISEPIAAVYGPGPWFDPFTVTFFEQQS